MSFWGTAWNYCLGQSCILFTVLKGSKAIDHHPPGILVIGVNLGMDGRDMSLIIFQLFQKSSYHFKTNKTLKAKIRSKGRGTKNCSYLNWEAVPASWAYLASLVTFSSTFAAPLYFWLDMRYWRSVWARLSFILALPQPHTIVQARSMHNVQKGGTAGSYKHFENTF